MTRRKVPSAGINGPRIAVRVRRVLVGDFRKSEETLYDELPASFKRTLKGNDAVCFVSMTGNQLQFVYGQARLGIAPKGKAQPRLTTSVRFRLTGRTWSHETLANDAEEYAGLTLVGWPRFEEFFAQRQAKKKAAA